MCCFITVKTIHSFKLLNLRRVCECDDDAPLELPLALLDATGMKGNKRIGMNRNHLKIEKKQTI